MTPPIVHGGALIAAQRAFPDAPKLWIDLSTGINPFAYPVGDISADAWRRLPEREEIAGLEVVAARAYGVRDAACVVAAPGVQSLIQLLPLLVRAQRVAVLGPTYEEHAQRWRAAGAQVAVMGDADADALMRSDVAIVVNPNNPDGRVLDVATLDGIAEAMRRRDGLLVVDESFADLLLIEACMAPRAAAGGIAVMRSFGKFYGLAGLRLGFAVAAPPLAERLRDALGPWAVSGPAVAIARTALADESWRAETRRRLAQASMRLDAALSSAGLAVLGGTDLFRFVAVADADAAHDRLCEHGILVRTFPAMPDRMRIGLPGPEEHWRRVEEALRIMTTQRCR